MDFSDIGMLLQHVHVFNRTAVLLVCSRERTREQQHTRLASDCMEMVLRHDLEEPVQKIQTC